MSGVESLSYLTRVQSFPKRRNTPLRGAGLRPEEQPETEQKRIGIEARKRLTSPPPKPLLIPPQTVVDKPVILLVSTPKPVENLDWPRYRKPAPYDSYVPTAGYQWEVDAGAIMAEFGISSAVLKGERRDRHVVQCRREIAQMLREVYQWSYPHIGRYMKRDHSSIISLLGRRKQQLGKATRRFTK